MTSSVQEGAPERRGSPLVDRREFLKLLGLLSTALAGPAACRPGERLGAPPAGRFLTDAERETLAALCDRILPPDEDPGAGALGAVDYVERLLTAFEAGIPRIYARGPFSGRNPWPDGARGGPSASFPPNDFGHYLPLSRLQELFWRAEIHGAEAAGLPAHLTAQRGGTLRGLRTVYREGLARVNELSREIFGLDFAALDTDQQDEMLPRFDVAGAFGPDPVRGQTFFDLVLRHTLEGCFAAPEYGGNAGAAGWRLLGLEGDSQPLGYAIHVPATDSYVERPELPLSTPNPDEVAADGSLAPRPLSADGLAIQKNISELTQFLELVLPGACLPGA